VEIDDFIVRLVCQQALVGSPLLVRDHGLQSTVEVFRPRVEEEQTRHLIRIGRGEEPAEEGAMGLPDEQVRGLDLRRLQGGMQIRHHLGSRARIVRRFVASLQTCAIIAADPDEFRGMNLDRCPDGAVVAIAGLEDHRRAPGTNAPQEDAPITDRDGAADDWVLGAPLRCGGIKGGNRIALLVTERRIEPIDIGGGEEVLRCSVLPGNRPCLLL
jgi:hypothetical protein